jgi:hypothetical protein
MKILDLAVLAKLVLYGLLVRLLVHVGHHYDPALDGANCGRLGVSLHVDSVGAAPGAPVAARRGGLVNIHLCVGHDGRWRKGDGRATGGIRIRVGVVKDRCWWMRLQKAGFWCGEFPAGSSSGCAAGVSGGWPGLKLRSSFPATKQHQLTPTFEHELRTPYNNTAKQRVSA